MHHKLALLSKNLPNHTMYHNVSITSWVSEGRLHRLPPVATAGVVVREALVARAGHQLQVLGHVFDNVPGFHLVHFPAAGVGQVNGAVHGTGGQVVLVRRAAAGGAERGRGGTSSQ